MRWMRSGQQRLREGLGAPERARVHEHAFVEQLHEVSDRHRAGLALDVLEGPGEQFGEDRARNAAIDLHRVCLPRSTHRCPPYALS